jgi:hypothetical protein
MSTLVINIQLTDGSKVVSLMRLPCFTPRKIPGTQFLLEAELTQVHSAAGRIR